MTHMRTSTLIAASLMLLGAGCVSLTPPKPTPVACTMEAKLCPDGSYVGRSGPNCEFAPCPGSPAPAPTPAPTPTSQSCSGDGDTSCPTGYRCIQDCGPPVVRVDSPPPAWHCVTNEVASKPRMCPICLAASDKIATPDGSVAAKDVRAGMTVWSSDAAGHRVATRVLSVARTPVPPSHQVVHLTLSDGRETWASPNHPTIDGRVMGELRPGDRYDGATVRAADLVPYQDDATYDLLPDSATGMYWADGVPLDSTLKQ